MKPSGPLLLSSVLLMSCNGPQLSTLEYNWFARARNYEGDLMTDDDFSGAGPFRQVMTLRGNIFVQNSLPGNHSQVITLYNDAGLANLTLSIRALYNTFVGVDTNSAFVHVSNATGTAMTTEISDNIIAGTRTPVLVESAGAATVTGVNNWLQTNASTARRDGIALPGIRFRPAEQLREVLLPDDRQRVRSVAARVFAEWQNDRATGCPDRSFGSSPEEARTAGRPAGVVFRAPRPAPCGRGERVPRWR